mgnify:CR=1 FL=1
MAFSENSDQLVSGGGDMRVLLYNLALGGPPFGPHTTAHGKWIATSPTDIIADYVFMLPTGDPSLIAALRFRWQGRVIRVRGVTGEWNRREGTAVLRYFSVEAHAGGTFELCYDPRGARWILPAFRQRVQTRIGFAMDCLNACRIVHMGDRRQRGERQRRRDAAEARADGRLPLAVHDLVAEFLRTEPRRRLEWLRLLLGLGRFFGRIRGLVGRGGLVAGRGFSFTGTVLL